MTAGLGNSQSSGPVRAGSGLQPVPAVVFAYNRPDLLRCLLDCLAGETVPELIAFVDGPRSPADKSAAAESAALLRKVRFCPVTLFVREENLGLGRSVVDGVTRALADHQAVVVFEDDLAIVPGTYRYVVSALEHYRDNPRVMSIAGWTHPKITPPGLGDQPYFDAKGGCWVWATWRRSWRGMELSAMELMNQCREKGLDIERYGSDMPKLAAEAQERNTWGIAWWYLHVLNESLCLRPPWSMVEHLGWDSRATTTTPEMLDWLNPPLRPCPPMPSPWPQPREHPACANLWRTAAGDPPLQSAGR